MCNFIGLWHFYNWPVLACEGKEKFSKVSVKLTCLQGRKWFSLTFCFAPWILSSPCVTPAAGAKMYFVNGRPGVLYQENWTMSAFTCLCSFPVLLLAHGCGVIAEAPAGSGAAFPITLGLPARPWSTLGSGVLDLGQG